MKYLNKKFTYFLLFFYRNLKIFILIKKIRKIPHCTRVHLSSWKWHFKQTFLTWTRVQVRKLILFIKKISSCTPTSSRIIWGMCRGHITDTKFPKCRKNFYCEICPVLTLLQLKGGKFTPPPSKSSILGRHYTRLWI